MNKADNKRMDALHRIGCLIAHMTGQPWTPACIHHCTRLGKRDNQKTIPLSPQFHNRDAVFGESVHNGYKLFRDKYGSEHELLDYVNDLL